MVNNNIVELVKKQIKKSIAQCVSGEIETINKTIDTKVEAINKTIDTKVEAINKTIDSNFHDRDKQLNELRVLIQRQENILKNYKEIIDSHVLNCFLEKSNSIVNNTIDDLIDICQHPIGVFDEIGITNVHQGLQILFNNKLQFFEYEKDMPEFDLAYIWGLKPWFEQSKIIVQAQSAGIPILMFEDGFIRSVVTWNNNKVAAKYRCGVSFTIDDKAVYINARQESRLECLLNSDFTLTNEQFTRARQVIDKIIKNKISKYNHQPIFTPKIGQPDRKKVLVVDQSYGDMSVAKGLATDETFKNMLECAIKENPDADIIIKTHPDAKSSKEVITGYYQTTVEHDNIYKVTYDINPISLLMCVDKVYVCTTQMGFEAVLCGKEVHVFGMPFYAGWGITQDRQTCTRRNRKRSIEEVFYITYIIYSKYISYKLQSRCEIEQVIQELLELRNQYFEEYNIRYDK